MTCSYYSILYVSPRKVQQTSSQNLIFRCQHSCFARTNVIIQWFLILLLWQKCHWIRLLLRNICDCHNIIVMVPKSSTIQFLEAALNQLLKISDMEINPSVKCHRFHECSEKHHRPSWSASGHEMRREMKILRSYLLLCWMTFTCDLHLLTPTQPLPPGTCWIEFIRWER